MFGARSSVLIVFLTFIISLVSGSNVCVLKPKSSCDSKKFAFIEGGLKPGNAIRVSVELLPQATFELTNSAFQNIATIRFGVSSCSIESSVSSVRAYGLYKNGRYVTGSVVSFDLVALSRSIGVFIAGEKLLEIPLLVAAPFMLSLTSEGKGPSFQYMEYSTNESNFCSFYSRESCSSSTLVSFKGGVQKKIKISSPTSESVPNDYFAYFFSAYSNIYKIPVLEVAFTKDKWYVTSKGSFIGQGNIPSNIAIGSTIEVSITPSSSGKILIEANSSSLGQFDVDPSEINFIYQSVSQGSMNVSY
ncbi:Gal/GalNAc binding lectin [Cryptosporidium ryanae]|uniref:Gal/GalNAc binding lectin n=1 Tax=Cryptosporidium ryanae TaxID=515981 RepID=UPI00351A38E0|nr:Gal/GalNAc binding lectin [Cryptosporidium ryanae]